MGDFALFRKDSEKVEIAVLNALARFDFDEVRDVRPASRDTP